MGFYGNITNTSNTTFSFDRIYPNRLAMDANANNDGIFIGRYVLVEYQEEAAYPVAYHATETSEDSGQYYFYSSTNQEEISKIKYLGLPPGEPDRLPSVDDVNAIYQDGFYKGEILQRYIYSSDKKDWIFSEEFYACVGEDDKHFAIFELITNPSMKSHYIQNFEIDEKHYGQESKGFKGYDSTVWMKSSVTASDGKLITKYVNIADLNSVVPTFDIAADAPTMNPITPHFDADSTNVYYKLHMQSPYGFRVAKKPEDGISDADTVWYETTYDKTQDKTETRKVYEGPADIYYNEAGFNPDVPSVVSNTAEDNYIKLEPTASSGATYSHGAGANDIQEFRLHLPAIGNMMSKAWDVIHGPKRDNARTDDNSSLQCRLDSFRFMAGNQIPVKRANDGTLIGTNINGNNQCEVPEQGILGQSLTTSFDTDDAWIRTEINTNGLLDELGNEIGNNGISIHHTFHSKEDTETSANKNNSDGDGINKGIGNDLKLYTPIVDAAGHVVGKNTETVTLPYGYKTFTTNGRGEDTEINTFDKVAAKTQNIVAENTQDELAINSGNEWIRIDTDAINDILTISHDIHKTSSDSHDTDWTQTETNTTIPTTTYEFDNAGHYVSHHTENYKLPFGYGKIVGDSGSTKATATYDEVKFTSDEWLTATIDKDTVTYSHDYPNMQEDTSTDFDMNTATTQDNKDKIVLETLRHDDTGHIINVNQHTVTLPYGYKTIKIANNSNGVATPASTVVEAGQSADQTQDTLNLNASNKWIVMDNAEDDIIKFGHKISPLNKKILNPKDTAVTHFGDSFNLLNFAVDEAGHITGCNEDEITITIPQGDHENINNADNDGNVIPTTNLVSSIELDKPSGKITARYNTTNSIKLSGYEINKNNNHSADINAIADNDTLNTAFAKLQNQIDNEIKLRKAAIDTLYYGEESPEGIKIAETFDTIKEIADFLEQDSSNGRTGVEIIIDDIDTLKGNDTVSGSVANSIKNAIDGLDSSISATTENYISGITIAKGKITKIEETIIPVREVKSGTTNGTILVNGSAINVGGLKSAAYTESSAYAKADILDTKFDYGTTEQKTIADLMDKVAELEEKLNELNNQINSPQEPDEGGETV